MKLYWITKSVASSAFQSPFLMNCDVNGKPTCTVTGFGDRFFRTNVQEYTTRSMALPLNKKKAAAGNNPHFLGDQLDIFRVNELYRVS